MKKFLEILSKSKMFTGLTAEELLLALQCILAKHAAYKKETCIIFQGQQITHVGIVASGKVRIQREDVNGNAILLTELSPGDIFAEAYACAETTASPVSVWAISDADIVFFKYKKITGRCTNTCAFHTRIIENMLKLMAQKLIYMNEKMEIIQKHTLREKLLAFFEVEMRGAGSKKFTTRFNRNELSAYIGGNRSALSRELCNMRDEGLIWFKGNDFEVLY